MPRKILIYTLLVCLAVLMGTPLAWMVLSSVKPNSDLFSYPPVWLPSRITLEHYQHAFQRRLLLGTLPTVPDLHRYGNRQLFVLLFSWIRLCQI